jgi:hypothetical protein
MQALREGGAKAANGAGAKFAAVRVVAAPAAAMLRIAAQSPDGVSLHVVNLRKQDGSPLLVVQSRFFLAARLRTLVQCASMPQ